MKRPVFAGCLLMALRAPAQTLPHRMRVGLTADLGGATLGIGTQLHGSFRFSDDYRAFDDRHQYINVGVGIGASLSSALSVGQTVPHYISYGAGRGRTMWEFGVGGVARERLTLTTLDPISNQKVYDPKTDWQYLPFVLVGYRYTAYSGFTSRIYLATVILGVSLGWMF